MPPKTEAAARPRAKRVPTRRRRRRRSGSRSTSTASRAGCGRSPARPGNYRSLQANRRRRLLPDGRRPAGRAQDVRPQGREGADGPRRRSAATSCRPTARSCSTARATTTASSTPSPARRWATASWRWRSWSCASSRRPSGAQMYVDAWRILRDWFYDPNMHGLDWAAMRDRYGALRALRRPHRGPGLHPGRAGRRAARPATSTCSRRRRPGPERVENGLLGAEVEPHSSGYYRVTKIYPGENWHQDFRSPLTEPGVNVKEGDYILAVDGTLHQGGRQLLPPAAEQGRTAW